MMVEKHVLVIDDDAELCTSMVEALKRAGYKSVGSSSMQEAKVRMRNQTYHCILVDLRLGENSGEDLVAFIRTCKDALNTRTPLVLISGHLDKGVVARLAREIQGALVKPFQIQALLDVVNRLTL